MFQHSRNGSVEIISANVPLTAENVPEAAQAFEQCFGKGQPRLVFNLADVPLLDSAGLELLLDVRDRCMQQGGAIQLAAPVPLCRDILRATDVAAQIAIFDDVVTAVGSYSK